MAKVKGPLLSLQASGDIGNAVQFQNGRNGPILRKKPSIIQRVASEAQQVQRDKYGRAVEQWRALTASEKADYDVLGSRDGVSGFNWFIRSFLNDQVMRWLYDFGPPAVLGQQPSAIVDLFGDPIINVVSDEEALNGRAVEASTGSAVFVDPVAAIGPDDYEVVCRERITVNPVSGFVGTPGLRLSNSGIGGITTGYIAERLPSANITVIQRRNADGSTTAINGVQFIGAVGEWVWSRFRVNGSTLKLKQWTGNLEDEPAEWMVEGSDSTWPTGAPGIIQRAGNVSRIDVTAIAKGGLTAKAG